VTQTYVAVQPDGLDPCDLRRKHGPEAVADLIARRVHLYEFVIRSELADYDVETPEGRIGGLDTAARHIARIKDDGLRRAYAWNLDRWLGLNDQGLVLARVAQHLRGARSVAGRAQPAPPARRRRAAAGERSKTRAPSAEDAQPYDLGDPVIKAEREALKLAIQRPALCGPAFDVLGPAAFTAPPHVAVREMIENCGGARGAAGAQQWVARLRDAASDDQIRGFVTRLAVEPLHVPKVDGEADTRYADAVLAQVEARAVSRRITEVKSRLQRLNPIEAQPEYNRAFGDLVALEQRHKALVEKAVGAF